MSTSRVRVRLPVRDINKWVIQVYARVQEYLRDRGKGRKGREGKGRGRGREGKGREAKGRELMEWERREMFECGSSRGFSPLVSFEVAAIREMPTNSDRWLGEREREGEGEEREREASSPTLLNSHSSTAHHANSLTKLYASFPCTSLPFPSLSKCGTLDELLDPWLLHDHVSPRHYPTYSFTYLSANPLKPLLIVMLQSCSFCKWTSLYHIISLIYNFISYNSTSFSFFSCKKPI